MFLGVQCPSLLTDGADVNTTDVTYETYVNVSCYDGFQISTDQQWVVTQCQANKTWSAQPSTCTRECIFNRSQNEPHLCKQRNLIFRSEYDFIYPFYTQFLIAMWLKMVKNRQWFLLVNVRPKRRTLRNWTAIIQQN